MESRRAKPVANRDPVSSPGKTTRNTSAHIQHIQHIHFRQAGVFNWTQL